MSNFLNNTSDLEKILNEVDGIDELIVQINESLNLDKLNNTSSSNTSITIKISINWTTNSSVSKIYYFDANRNYTVCTSSGTIDAIGGIVLCYMGTDSFLALTGEYTGDTNSSLYCFHSDGGTISVSQSDEPL